MALTAPFLENSWLRGMDYAKIKFSRQLRIFAFHANRHTFVCLILVVNHLFRWLKSSTTHLFNKKHPQGAFFIKSWLRGMDFARSAHHVPAMRKFVVIRTSRCSFSYTNFEPATALQVANQPTTKQVKQKTRQNDVFFI